jgi:uncharacterized protein YecT (DUF1311 family)
MTGAGERSLLRPGCLAMLNVDLSTLRGQELRQLLDSTRRRGDAAVTYEILQEMAARRERGEPEPTRRLFGPRRPSEPRLIELNLGDPLDPKEDDFEDPPRLQAVEAWELEPVDDDVTYLHPPAPDEPEAPPPAAKPRRRGLWLGSGLLLGLVAGMALGGWAESFSQQTHMPPTTLAAATPPPAPAAAAAADPIAVETETAPETPPAATSDAITPAAAPTTAPVPQPAPPATQVAEAAMPAAPPSPAADTVKVAAKASVKAPAKEALKDVASEDDAAPATPLKAGGACAGQPTPADRIICQTPSLQHLQKALRQAYADALDAHQDRDLLREHQLAWADARNTVTEPDRLARLYEERIRKLNAAAAEARAER